VTAPSLALNVPSTLRAPFPWFGGKSKAAHLIWPRFGNVPNYIAPFAGSLAVALARPAAFPPRVETVNDKDAYLANFWRAVNHDPDQVAFYADYPVNEADLHARHRWLVETARERVERVMTDPEFFDAKVAGWWVWGQCLWIGSGWCASDPSRNRGNEYPPGQAKRPHCDRGSGRGVHKKMGDSVNQRRRPQLTHDNGVHRHANGSDADRTVDWNQRPDLTNTNGRGGVMTSTAPARKRPHISNRHGDGGGMGVHRTALTTQLPQLSGDGSGSPRGVLSNGIAAQSDGLYGYMRDLCDRLRRVRVCCGDWQRVLTPAVTTYIGITGVLLDPPYSHAEREICYSHDEDVSAAVRQWAIEHGDDPKMRIALCGYQDEHEMPSSWEAVAWKAGGGYGRTDRGRSNRERERIWFSPHCLKPELPLWEISA
jgi:hypothetical protein